MSIYKMNFFGPVSFLERQWHQRLVQISVFAALLFFLLGSYDLIDQIQKMLRKVGLKFGKDSTRVVNSALFGLLLFLLTRFVMDPVIKRMAGGIVEGQTNDIGLVELTQTLGPIVADLQTKPNDPIAKRDLKLIQRIMKEIKSGSLETSGIAQVELTQTLGPIVVDLQTKPTDPIAKRDLKLIQRIMKEIKGTQEPIDMTPQEPIDMTPQQLAEEKEYLDQQLLLQQEAAQEAALEADIKDKSKDKLKEQFSVTKYWNRLAAAGTDEEKCTVTCNMAPLNSDALCPLYKHDTHCKNPCPACP